MALAVQNTSTVAPNPSSDNQDQAMLANCQLRKMIGVSKSFVFSFLSNQDLCSLLSTSKVRSRIIRPLKNSQAVSKMLNSDPYKVGLAVQVNKYKAESFPFEDSFLSLKFCPCPHLTLDGRKFLVTNSMNLLEQTQHPKNLPLRIVSVGAGDCYQELVFLKNLAEAGYKQIELVLIDEKAVPLKGLSDFCKGYLPECKITITYCDSLERYAKYAHNTTNNDPSQPLEFTTVKDNFKPDLLLLLDVAHYDVNENVTGQIPEANLTNYSFKLFKHLGLIKENTVVTYTDRRQTSTLREPFVKCGYAGQSTELSQVGSVTNDMPAFDLTTYS